MALRDKVLEYLLSQELILSSPCYNRVYIDTWLPIDYSRSSGAAIVFRPRGGAGEDNFIVNSLAFEFRCFSPNKNDTTDAFAMSDALKAAFELKTYPNADFYPRILSGEDLTRDEQNWYVVSILFQISEVEC